MDGEFNLILISQTSENVIALSPQFNVLHMKSLYLILSDQFVRFLKV